MVRRETADSQMHVAAPMAKQHAVGQSGGSKSERDLLLFASAFSWFSLLVPFVGAAIGVAQSNHPTTAENARLAKNQQEANRLFLSADCLWSADRSERAFGPERS